MQNLRQDWRVGAPGIEPGLQAPHACVLPVYYAPRRPQYTKKKADHNDVTGFTIHTACMSLMW